MRRQPRSLETGQELLLREGLFPSVRGEIQADLYKLRPYRILELLALPAEREAERYNGLRLLQDILQDRVGIDGKGNDQSGLGTDDFLRFIQQLRSYLTVSEQQQIFETEANRPSAVATYLAVYAFIAGGFAHRQPSLVHQAKQLLSRLGNRQDVKLEQSVCSLLLGQTEEANRLVEQTQEQQTLAYIRKHSEGSPDLLPGLCLYAEQWLRAEVFPQFRDLSEEDASLKGYFADPEVQSYLESLPGDESQTFGASRRTSLSKGTTTYSNGHNSQRSPTYQGNRAAMVGAATVGAIGATATRARTQNPEYGQGNATTLQPAERVSPLPSSPEGSLSRPEGNGADADGTAFQSPQLANVPQGTVITPRTRSKTGPRIDRLLFLACMGILGLLIMWMIASRIYGWLSRSTPKALLPGEQLELQVNQPPVNIPSPSGALPSANLAEGELDVQGAESIIRAWLNAKTAAMGPDYDRSSLEDILADNVLTRWQGESQEAEQTGYHRTYEYPNIEINDVTWSEDNPDSASIAASVTETSQFYQGEQPDINKFYDSSLSVVYGVVRKDGQWKIQSISTQ